MSKKIRRFPSGAVRSDNSGRERPDFISPYSIKAIGEFFAGFAGDFGQVNYFKGIPEEVVYESLTRHMNDLHIAILSGDTEAIRREFQAVCANGIMGLHTVEIKRIGLYREVHAGTELIEPGTQDEALPDRIHRLQGEVAELTRQLREQKI